ncbi:hypothetical protein ACU6U9_21545 [Pseudomonas sp. HK3]
MDKYGTGEDPLCYPDSKVLINHLDIYDQNELDQAETEITDFTASEIEFSLPPYDLPYLCKIHETLFSDINARRCFHRVQTLLRSFYG